MIQDTSERAFREEVEPTLAERHQRVMAALLELQEATNSELSRHLGWSINRVTPRIFELRLKDKVVEIGKRPCKVTGRMAYVWAIKVAQRRLL